VLERVLLLLEAGQADRALDELVWAWGPRRLTELGEIIERLGPQVDEARPSLAAGPALDRDWRARAEGARPCEVGRLLQSYRKGTPAEIEGRMQAMLGWQPDPRVAAAMLALLQQYTPRSQPRLWGVAFQLMVRNADPRRAAELLEPRPMLEDVEEALYQAEEGADPLVEGEQAVIAQIEREISRRERARAPEQDLERSLLDAVVAQLDRDEPRLIYADWLHEREDPRGELIRLEMALAAGKRVKGKRDALLKAEVGAILGPLGPIVENPAFDRGLLDTVWVSREVHATHRSADDLRERLLDPRWRTVRQLVGDHDLSLVLRHAPLDSIVSLSCPPLASLLAVTERQSPLPLRSATLFAYREEPALYDRLADALPWLPQLEEIVLDGWDPEMPALPLPSFFRGPVARQLERLTAQPCAIYRIDQWLEQLLEAGSPLPSVRLPGVGALAELERAPDGRYRLRLAPSSDADDQQRLAGALRQVRAAHVASLELDPAGARPRRALTDALRHLPRA
jgi:uncharacterized protein (TIGR02996 family)